MTERPTVPVWERIVRVTHGGVLYKFLVEADPPLSFWRVETAGRPPERLPLRALGTEQPEFFRSLAKLISVSPGAVSRAWWPLRATARGLGKVRPHGLRHAAITEALDATAGDVRKVARFLAPPGSPRS